MTSRMWRCSSQVDAMRPARTRPMPGTSVSRSGVSSMTAKVVSPKASTMRPALTGPIPLTRPERGPIFGSLELPAMFGVVAPPAMSDDGLAGLQIRQGADEGDEPLILQGRDRLPVAPLRGETRHSEAVLGVLKRDAFNDPAQFSARRGLGSWGGARCGCGRHEEHS